MTARFRYMTARFRWMTDGLKKRLYFPLDDTITKHPSKTAKNLKPPITLKKTQKTHKKLKKLSKNT
jgi:hypothetical protein